jgi:hypothetical protein
LYRSPRNKLNYIPTDIIVERNVRERMRKEKKHLIPYRNAGATICSALCWCGCYHRIVQEIGIPMKVGLITKRNSMRYNGVGRNFR